MTYWAKIGCGYITYGKVYICQVSLKSAHFFVLSWHGMPHKYFIKNTEIFITFYGLDYNYSSLLHRPSCKRGEKACYVPTVHACAKLLS